MNTGKMPSPTPADKNDEDRRQEIARDKVRVGVALSGAETVSRYGSANAEYIKGYAGIDHETGQTLHDGLKSLSQKNTGLPQKAGTAAEIHATNRDNANNIIDKTTARSARTDDLSRQYGANHPIADRLHVHADGTVSYSQMKFEGNVDVLVKKIVSKNGGYAKYLDPQQVCEERARRHLDHALRLDEKAKIAETQGKVEAAAQHRKNAEDLRTRAANNQEIGISEIKLEVPTEQVDLVKKQCQDNASRLRADAVRRETDAAVQDSLGNTESAQKLRNEAREFIEEADRNDRLAEQVVDSGLSQDEANLAASQPLRATVTSILKTSHRAGMEGAKFGAVVGGCISLLQNIFATAQGDKDLATAAGNVALDTTKAAAIGYSTTFVGATLKGGLQQSSRAGLRTLANTNAPALVVNICLSLGSSVKRYVTGEITESQLLLEVGEKGSGMLSASMMAALGQLAIPIPFVGAAVGGMIGYTLSSMFYQSALDAARGAEASRERLERIRGIEAAARARIAEEQAALDDFLRREIPELEAETQHLFTVVNDATPNQVDALAAAINRYAGLLGQHLQFQSMAEFDAFMKSDEPLRF
jgi:hypothetical protein